MSYQASDHPRAPKGTPQGGQFTQKAGVGIDDDLTPNYTHLSDEAIIEILNTPKAHSAEYDDMRTELCARHIDEQHYVTISYDELYSNLQEPDGGGTFSPISNTSVVSEFVFVCHLHDRVATVSSKSYASRVVTAWFAFHCRLPVRRVAYWSYVRSTRV